MKNTFGSRLKDIRRAKNITQRELASIVGVDYSYISKVENDRLPPPSAETIIKICEVLGIPNEDLLSETGKISSNVKEIITSSPDALKFFNELTTISFNKEKWGFLRNQLKKIK